MYAKRFCCFKSILSLCLQEWVFLKASFIRITWLIVLLSLKFEDHGPTMNEGSTLVTDSECWLRRKGSSWESPSVCWMTVVSTLNLVRAIVLICKMGTLDKSLRFYSIIFISELLSVPSQQHLTDSYRGPIISGKVCNSQYVSTN